MEMDEEETPKNPTSVPEPSPPTSIPSDDQISTTTNLPQLQLPPPVVFLTPAAQPVPLVQQTPVPPPIAAPITPPIVPPIAPIPSHPQVLRPLAPLLLRPPIIRPPAPIHTSETNASDSGSDHEDSSPDRSMEYEISEESKQVRERQEKAMQDHLLKRRAYALAVPTNDSAVHARLRWLCEPITLFGEREMERRDRLRMIMVKLDAEGQLDKLLKAHEDEEAANAIEEGDGEGPQQYPFYIEGSNELLQARMDIAKYSIMKAALRLERARRRADDPDEDLDAEMDWALKQADNLVTVVNLVMIGRSLDVPFHVTGIYLPPVQ